MFRSFGLRLSFAFALTAIAAPHIFAQSNVAVVNLQRAVLETAEIKKASADLEAKYKPRQAEMEKIQKELQDLGQKLQADAGKLTPQAEADLTGQYQRRQRELQRVSEDLQGDVERERNDILSGSSRRMQDVIRKLAEERKIDVIVEISNTLYVRPALEITNEAIAAYDKAYPPK
jgi:outer membrane protein